MNKVIINSDRMFRKFVFLFLIGILILNTVHALPIEILIEGERFEVGIGELEEIEISIKNNQNFRDSFSISVWPPTYIDLERDYVILNPGESKTIKMYILPSTLAETGTKQYMLVAISSSNPDVIVKKNFYVKIKRRSGVYISSFSVEEGILEPGKKLIVQTVVKNLDPFEHKNLMVEVIMKKDENTVKRKTKTINSILGNELKTLLTVFNISKYMPSGEYKIFCFLKDEKDRILDMKSETVTVVGIKRLEREKSIDYGLFHHTVTISLINEGNERLEKVIVSESMPKFMMSMIYPSVEPMSVEESDNKVVYKWIIPVMKPGEKVTIIYEVRFFNILVLVIITISIILIGIFHRITPKIEKRPREKKIKKERFITISLHVKNRFVKTIKDVVVEDLVPPIFVLLDYFESLKPNMKTTKNGIKLIWNLGPLKPGEERILVYRVKPRVEVMGKLKLPKAVMKYRGIIKRKKEVVSKSVEIVIVEKKKVL